MILQLTVSCEPVRYVFQITDQQRVRDRRSTSTNLSEKLLAHVVFLVKRYCARNSIAQRRQVLRI